MNASLRSQFPALQGQTIYLDGPAGTQVPDRVIEAVSHYYQTSNANVHGFFKTSQATDEIIDDARSKCQALLGARSSNCISFGANMTSLAYKLSAAFGRLFEPGDEVIITQLDHEANRGPWLALKERGVVVKEVNLKEDGNLDYEQAAQIVTAKTKLICVGLASNILGTVNNIAAFRQMADEVGAWLLIDAVHYAPHFPVDVRELKCDFLLCSAYKFYGPHVGILYCKPGLLNSLPTNRLRTGPQMAPGRIETGTLNHAALAGTAASIDFIASLGSGEGYRDRILSAYEQIIAHERYLAQKLYRGLLEIDGLTIYGLPFGDYERTPTLAITLEGVHPDDISKVLGQNNITSWSGHFYAIRATEVYDLLKTGGVVRLGISVYNTEEEIDKTIDVIQTLSKTQ